MFDGRMRWVEAGPHTLKVYREDPPKLTRDKVKFVPPLSSGRCPILQCVTVACIEKRSEPAALATEAIPDQSAAMEVTCWYVRRRL